MFWKQLSLYFCHVVVVVGVGCDCCLCGRLYWMTTGWVDDVACCVAIYVFFDRPWLIERREVRRVTHHIYTFIYIVCMCACVCVFQAPSREWTSCRLCVCGSKSPCLHYVAVDSSIGFAQTHICVLFHWWGTVRQPHNIFD